MPSIEIGTETGFGTNVYTDGSNTNVEMEDTPIPVRRTKQIENASPPIPRTRKLVNGVETG
jgi:hypothetical protein